jgi:hypothetical protein
MNAVAAQPDDRHDAGSELACEIGTPPPAVADIEPGEDTKPVRATAWTVETVRRLGLTTDVETAASILGISRTKAYALARSEEFPVRLVRAGRRYLVPTPALLDLLGATGTQ